MSISTLLYKIPVREYAEEMDVELRMNTASDRLVIRCYNECGYNCTELDLMDLIEWAKNVKPEIAE